MITTFLLSQLLILALSLVSSRPMPTSLWQFGTSVQDLFGTARYRNGMDRGSRIRETYDRLVRILALIESALGVEKACPLPRRGTFRLAFGSGDYLSETGTSADEMATACPRSRLVRASRIGSPPEPTTGQQWAAHAVVLALTGKLCPEVGHALGCVLGE